MSPSSLYTHGFATVIYNRDSSTWYQYYQHPNQSYTNCCLSLQAPASTSMQSTLDGHNPWPRVRPNSVQSSSQELGMLQLGLKEVTMWGTTLCVTVVLMLHSYLV